MNINRYIRKVGMTGLGVILALAAGCKKQTQGLFPESGEVAGWAKSGETRTFTAANLSDYIDGDAEKYLKAGVQSASTADYKLGDQVQATVDVYTMSSADGAKSIFESEPAGTARAAAVGDAGRLYSQSLMFRKGPYLVRIVAYRSAPQLEQAMVDLGQGIERKLPQ